MHKDEAKGAAKDMKGAMKQAVGKATGNERLEAEGVHHAGNGTQQLTAIDLGILLREPNALECD